MNKARKGGKRPAPRPAAAPGRPGKSKRGRLNVVEAKANLSRALKRVAEGETIVLCRRNVPIAELRPIEPEAAAGAEARPIGLAAGTFAVPASFFEALPGEVVAGFEGAG